MRQVLFLLMFVFALCVLMSGCGSIKLHERKASHDNAADQGTITEIELKGPKAQVSHKF
jgi:uncharacterized protein YceK